MLKTKSLMMKISQGFLDFLDHLVIGRHIVNGIYCKWFKERWIRYKTTKILKKDFERK